MIILKTKKENQTPELSRAAKRRQVELFVSCGENYEDRHQPRNAFQVRKRAWRGKKAWRCRQDSGG